MMLAMTKELLISVADIEAIVVICKTCKCQIRFKPEFEWQDSMGRDTPFSACPLCYADFDSTLKTSLLSLRSNWRSLREYSNVSFQVNAERTSP